MGVRRFRNMRSCSVNPPRGTMFTLKSAFAFRDLIYEELGAEAGWKPTCREVCHNTCTSILASIHLRKIGNTGHDNDMWLTSGCTGLVHRYLQSWTKRRARGAPESLAIALCRHHVPRITAGSLLAAAETDWAAALHVQFHPGARAPQIRQ